MAAKPVKQLGPQTQLVDVSGAKSLEAAINAYRADSRVRLAAADLLMCATETPNYTCTVTMNAAKSVTARFDRTGEWHPRYRGSI
jgi:hypothetical protein